MLSACIFVLDLSAVERFLPLVGSILPLDRKIELAIRGLLGPAWYGFFAVVSFFGDTVDRIIEVVLVLAFAGIWRKWADAGFIAVAAAGDSVLTTIVKVLAHRPRPHLFPRPVAVSGYSFPSGHSGTVVVFGLLIIFLTWRFSADSRLRIGAIALAIGFTLLVGLSRIVLGVHFPSDVIGGFALGTAWFLLVLAVFRRLREGGPQEPSSAPA